MTDKRRANLSKILINVGSVMFATLVITNFTGVFSVVKLIVGSAACIVCFGMAIWIEK